MRSIGLVRGAELVDVEGKTVRVAGLLDLLRIPKSVDDRGDRQKIEAWLSERVSAA
jgi:hypothetical protein